MLDVQRKMGLLGDTPDSGLPTKCPGSSGVPRTALDLSVNIEEEASSEVSRKYARQKG